MLAVLKWALEKVKVSLNCYSLLFFPSSVTLCNLIAEIDRACAVQLARQRVVCSVVVGVFVLVEAVEHILRGLVLAVHLFMKTN